MSGHRHFQLVLLLIPLLAACAHQGPLSPGPLPWHSAQGAHEAPKPPPETAASPGRPMDFAAVAAAYTGTCVSGERLSNNCAHFLGDAIIRAGHDDLLTSEHITVRCPAGRPIRAQEMLRWFQHHATEFHLGIPENSGWWFGYQEKPGRRHVLLLNSDTGAYYGTDHCTDWPVQWFYRW